MKQINTLWITLCIVLSACSGKQDNAKVEEDSANTVEISSASQQEAGIKTSLLTPRILSKVVTAPGEIVANTDLSTVVTTKVPAQIIKRFVQVGQEVSVGQPLAILSSVEMAKAQGDALMAAQDWQRIKSLGKAAVSAKRYAEADVAAQHAGAKLVAYGMTPQQVATLLTANDSQKATGEFELLASKSGTLFEANGVEGAMIEPGKVLFSIVNKSSLWVDARLAPNQAEKIKVGAEAWIKVDQKKFIAQVLQVHPQLDEITRTQIIRIEIKNPSDYLRPGQFVECEIAIGQTPPVLAIPTNALLQSSDNDWVVYTEEKPDHFEQHEVKVVESIADDSVITGIKPGVRIVTENAFFVHSELGKGNVDVHGH